MPFDVSDDLKSLKNRNMSHKGGGFCSKPQLLKLSKFGLWEGIEGWIIQVWSTLCLN